MGKWGLIKGKTLCVHFFKGWPVILGLLPKVEEVLRSGTWVKVEVPECRNTLLQYKSCIQNVTQVKVEKYYHQNIVKVPTVKVVFVQIGPFQNNIYDMFYNDWSLKCSQSW